MAIYWTLMPPVRWLAERGDRWTLGALASLPLIASALLLAGAPASFTALFVYVVAAAGLLLPPWPALTVIAATAAGVAIGAVATGADGSAVATWVLTIVSIGAIMTGFGRMLRSSASCERPAKSSPGSLSSEERLRIARDLHDLLGHSLSLIALKTELAARLVRHDTERPRRQSSPTSRRHPTRAGRGAQPGRAIATRAWTWRSTAPACALRAGIYYTSTRPA